MEAGQEDVVEEMEVILTGKEDLTQGSGREYEVGFRYDPSSSGKVGGEGGDSESETDSDDDNDLIFRKGMQNAADSSDEEEEEKAEAKEKEKAVFSMKTLTLEEREAKAVAAKEEGNVCYKKGDYQQAVACYRRARQWLPPPRLTAICLSNESASHGKKQSFISPHSIRLTIL